MLGCKLEEQRTTELSRCAYFTVRAAAYCPGLGFPEQMQSWMGSTSAIKVNTFPLFFFFFFSWVIDFDLVQSRPVFTELTHQAALAKNEMTN